MRNVTIGDDVIAYKDSGGTEKKTIILIHGAGGTSFFFTPIWASLRGEYRLVIPDLPGHGESTGTPPGSIEGYVEWLRRFITEIEVNEFILGGHSMGGAIAQMAAIDKIEGLEGVILISTGAKLKVHPKIFEGIRSDFPSFCEQCASMMVSSKAFPELIQEIAANLKTASPAVVESDFAACDRFDVRDRLGEIDVPALIISGDEDVMTPLYYGEFLAQQIKESNLKIIKGAGHCPVFEDPDAVTLAIRDFVQSL